MALAAAVVVVAAGGVAARAATETIPPPRATLRLAATVRVPGTAPQLAWPAHGEAALAGADGSVLGSSGGDKAFPIASITKVMTAYLVLKDHPLAAGQNGFNVTVTAAQAAELPARLAADQSVVALRAGQVISERAALEALLLPSADNVADILATYDAGSVAAFVTKMNATAARLGMTSAHFADASGLNPATVCNATDLLTLARAALADPTFASIVAQPSATVPGLGKLKNYNTLVGTDGFTGIKTGSTIQAGQALLFSVSRPVGGRTIKVLGAVLEQHGGGVVGGALDAAKALADSYYAQVQTRTVLPAGTPVVTASRVGHTATLTTRAPIRLVTRPGATVRLYVSVERPAGRMWATVRAAAPLDHGQARTGTWAVPSPGVGWRLSHLF